MTSPPPSVDARRGILFALLAFCGFPIGDMFIKSLAGSWPPLAVGALRFSIGAVGFAAILLLREGPAGFRVRRPWMHLARGLALTVATASFFSAIFIMPLADASAIQFINPILTALLAVLLLGERLSALGWSATLLGFVGVLFMLQPNGESFGWVAALPLLSAVGVSSLIILNRLVATQSSIWAAQFYMAFWAACFLALGALVGHLLHPDLAISTPPSSAVVGVCMLVAVTAGTCHYLMYSATVAAGAAVIAPIVYVQLPVATLISVWVFGDPLKPLVLVGGLLILLSGLALWLGSGGGRRLLRLVGRLRSLP
ncbi:MAG: DMT family transporter [Pseudomonadota bacterium]